VERIQKATELIRQITEEAEVGAIYVGKVKRVMDFGAIVELFPGTDGLLHISQLDYGHPRRVTDVINEGDEVLVKVLEIDDYGKIRLSRRAALEEQGAGGKAKDLQENISQPRREGPSRSSPKRGSGKRNDRRGTSRPRR
jgi:polyribonucleotide nucleotidyltransferase